MRKISPVPVASLNPEDTAGLEGCYVRAPECNFPVYIPKLNDEGNPVLPDDWYEDWEEVPVPPLEPQADED